MTSIYCPTTIICVLVVLLYCSSAQEGDLTTTGTVSGSSEPVAPSFTGETSTSTAQSTHPISSGDDKNEISAPRPPAATSAPQSPTAPTAAPADLSTKVPDFTSTSEAPSTILAGNLPTTPSMNSSLSPTANVPTVPNDVSSTVGNPTSEAWTGSYISSKVSQIVSTEGAPDVTKFPSSVSPSVYISPAEAILPSRTVNNVIVTPTPFTTLPPLEASASTCQTSPPFCNAHDSMTTASASASPAPSTLPVSDTTASSHTTATSPPLAPNSLRPMDSGSVLTWTIPTLPSLKGTALFARTIPTLPSLKGTALFTRTIPTFPSLKGTALFTRTIPTLPPLTSENIATEDEEDNKSSDDILPTPRPKTESQASSLLLYFLMLLIIVGVLLTLTYRKKIIALFKRTKTTAKKYNERDRSKMEGKSLLENEYV